MTRYIILHYITFYITLVVKLTLKPRKLCYRKDNRAHMTARCALYKWIEWAVAEYGHSKLSKMAACSQSWFVRTVNSAVRSTVPENPTLEPNMKWIGSPVAEIWPFAYVGGIWNPILGKGRS